MKRYIKKTLFLIVLMLGIASLVPAQSGGPIDLVVLLDTSASMSASYRTTSDYLIGPFLKEFLRIGDTFHLISFASSPKLEISRRVEGVGDVETIIGRMLLMYPLDPSSDLSGALSFAGNYASSIPIERRKKIVLISDGDGNSAPAQRVITDASARLTGQGTEFQYIQVPVTGAPSSGRPPATARPPQGQGEPARPSGSAGSPGIQERPPAQPPASGSASQGQAQVPAADLPAPPSGQVPGGRPSGGQAQDTQGGQGQISQPPGGQAQTGQSPVDQIRPGPPVSQDSAGSGSGEPPAAPASEGASVPGGTPPPGSGEAIQPPPTVPPGETTVPSGETIVPSPPRQESSREVPRERFSGSLPLPLIIGLGIAALLVLALIIFFAARNLHGSPNRAMAQAASVSPAGGGKHAEEERENQKRSAEMMSSFAASQKTSGTPPLSHPPPKPKPLPKDKPDNQSFENGPPMVSLFVEDQNTAIGRRNIHALKAGYTFSVGGGKSDFLIFLVPIPPHIADVHFDGRQCTFIPRKPQYFPDIGSQEVPNCIGKTIRVISDKRYELHVRVERYEDPLKTLNKLLHSIAVPGEVSR
jgi:hypothetical protein